MIYGRYFNLKRTVLVFSLLFLSILLLFPLVVHGKNQGCFQYEETEVTLTGKVFQEVYAGPPNYESIKEGDMPFTATILKLDDPVCVIAKPDDEMNETVYDEKEIHINFSGKSNIVNARKNFKGIIDKKVVVTGSFYSRHTGYHRRRTVLWTTDLKLSEPQSSAILGEIDAKCLKYEPASVTLKGMLYKARFRGAPDNLTQEEQDKLFSAWMLFLPKRHVCVNDRSKGKPDEPEYDVTEIQLEEVSSSTKPAEHMNGEEVVVTGKLFRSNGERYWSRIAMRIEKLNVNDSNFTGK